MIDRLQKTKCPESSALIPQTPCPVTTEYNHKTKLTEIARFTVQQTAKFSTWSVDTMTFSIAMLFFPSVWRRVGWKVKDLKCP
jgi:hypothetical protein